MKIMNKFIFPASTAHRAFAFNYFLFSATKSRPDPDPIQTKSRLNMHFFEDFKTFSHTKGKPA